MPKDSKKNRYFQIGIAWDSWTLGQLEQDAKLHQMDDQPAKLVVVRLTEYYKLVEKGVIIPGVSAMMQQPQGIPLPNGHSSNGVTPAASSTSKRGGRAAAPAASQEPEEQSVSTVAESEAAGDNADEALDFFLMDEDEEDAHG